MLNVLKFSITSLFFILQCALIKYSVLNNVLVYQYYINICILMFTTVILFPFGVLHKQVQRFYSLNLFHKTSFKYQWRNYLYM